ncbi:MAG: Dyp-type peroxidase [Janthinobacterium lividum]
MSSPTLANIQAIITQRYAYPFARHHLLAVVDAAAARARLRAWLPRVMRADADLSGNPEPLLNIGITWLGLRTLIPAAEFTSAEDSFPQSFRNLVPEPEKASWKGRFDSADVHVLICLHCRTETVLDDASRALRGELAPGFSELQPNVTGDPAITAKSLGGRKLHFGFLDGISEPSVNWTDRPNQPDLVDMRQFLLGYWSEEVQSSPSAGRWADFVRDGSYGVFQWIRQDVALFEQYLTANAPALAPDLPPAESRELLAAKMMGRWRNGTPLALSPDKADDTLANATRFGYGDDPIGLRCPLHAHIRLANPRDEPLNEPVRQSVPPGGPLLLRRGLPYGPEFAGEDDDGVDRGLVGLFFCANLQSQFFMIMRWINKADFSPVFNPRRLRWQDMLMADRSTPDAVLVSGIVQPNGNEVPLPALPQFLHWQGTLLLLFPSLSGLHEIAE